MCSTARKIDGNICFITNRNMCLFDERRVTRLCFKNKKKRDKIPIPFHLDRRKIYECVGWLWKATKPFSELTDWPDCCSSLCQPAPHVAQQSPVPAAPSPRWAGRGTARGWTPARLHTGGGWPRVAGWTGGQGWRPGDACTAIPSAAGSLDWPQAAGLNNKMRRWSLIKKIADLFLTKKRHFMIEIFLNFYW